MYSRIGRARQIGCNTIQLCPLFSLVYLRLLSKHLPIGDSISLFYNTHILDMYISRKCLSIGGLRRELACTLAQREPNRGKPKNTNNTKYCNGKSIPFYTHSKNALSGMETQYRR